MNWISRWLKSDYQEAKQKQFEIIDQYLNFEVKSILDIGCGIAYESIAFNKKYNTELTLLDSHETDGRRSGWGDNNSFKFYNNLEILDQYFQSIDLKNYSLHDVTKYESNKKFDVICSYLSCGFHYPIDTYLDLISKHMHKETRLIFSLRKNIQHNCHIIHTILEEPKFKLAEIQLLSGSKY